MNAQSGLRPDRAVGEALRTIAREVLGEAEAVLADGKIEPSVAIHEFRKAMKRWRALLRLLSPILGGEGQQLRHDARDLARTFTAARDVQSAIDILTDVAAPKGVQQPLLSPRSIETIRARLLGLKGASEAVTWDPKRRVLLENYIAAASYQVTHWPLDDVTFHDFAAGVAATYRRGRRAVPADWTRASAEELHDLRRRVVEHRYQMEWVEPVWPRLGRLWVDEAQRLRNRLGKIQDLAVLARFTEPHQPLAPWRSRLAPLIAQARNAELKGAAKIATRMFAETPKAFERRLVTLWEAQTPS